jgi:hemerythrin-like metal-binding protein
MLTKPQNAGTALVATLVKRYTLGHPEIDTQHRRLFEIVAAADDGAPVTDLLDEVLAYSAFHFQAEEQIAATHQVTDEKHIQSHRDLLDKIRIYKSHTHEVRHEVRTFLVEWVTTHIDKEDRRLVRRMQTGARH